jgi:hypothetical protein
VSNIHPDLIQGLHGCVWDFAWERSDFGMRLGKVAQPKWTKKVVGGVVNARGHSESATGRQK